MPVEQTTRCWNCPNIAGKGRHESVGDCNGRRLVIRHFRERRRASLSCVRERKRERKKKRETERESMHIHGYICMPYISIYIYTHTHTHTHTYMHIHIPYIYIYTCIYMITYLHTYLGPLTPATHDHWKRDLISVKRDLPWPPYAGDTRSLSRGASTPPCLQHPRNPPRPPKNSPPCNSLGRPPGNTFICIHT